MKQQVETALRALEIAKNEIAHIKEKLPEDDPRRTDVDDAELGVDWIKQRLDKLKQSAARVELPCSALRACVLFQLFFQIFDQLRVLPARRPHQGSRFGLRAGQHMHTMLFFTIGDLWLCLS